MASSIFKSASEKSSLAKKRKYKLEEQSRPLDTHPPSYKCLVKAERRITQLPEHVFVFGAREHLFLRGFLKLRRCLRKFAQKTAKREKHFPAYAI